MPRSQKQKGSRVEREIVKLFTELGYRARRQPLSGALQQFPHDVYIADLLGGTTAEVKARKDGKGFTQLENWKGTAELLILKRNNATPFVCMDWKYFKELIGDREEDHNKS
tara:strand:+ start:148 stop:480 length:333 start_codon:yes stop_codon:yes gene_type:complete